jgi:inorganic phosphate transporter, PiT family
MDVLASFFHTTDPKFIGLGLMAIGFGIYMAWTIGANDVANAMATSVGSGSISHKKAVIIAGVFNFSGAVLAGGTVTDTVRKGIVNTNLFEQEPTLLIIGMVSTLLAAAIWLHVATFFAMPVSTTHSIVGAIVGFGLLVYGLEAVNWGKVAQIIMSWVISPLGGGLLSYILFKFIRKTMLNAKNPGKATMFWAPLFGALTVGIIAISMIWKGLKNFHLQFSALQMFGIAFIAGTIGYIIIAMIIRSKKNEDWNDIKNVEKIFMVLQLITACYVAFAHGSNDVANAIGPMAAVISTIEHGVVAAKVPVPFWILLFGGIGILLGLATYGYRVMATVGSDITEITPSRGFAAQFSAATVVLLCSKMGLPISTTHTLVGGVLGIGFAQGFDSLNTRVVRTIILSWLLTLPIAAILTMIIFFIIRTVLGL